MLLKSKVTSKTSNRIEKFRSNAVRGVPCVVCVLNGVWCVVFVLCRTPHAKSNSDSNIYLNLNLHFNLILIVILISKMLSVIGLAQNKKKKREKWTKTGKKQLSPKNPTKSRKNQEIRTRGKNPEKRLSSPSPISRLLLIHPFLAFSSFTHFSPLPPSPYRKHTSHDAHHTPRTTHTIHDARRTAHIT